LSYQCLQIDFKNELNIAIIVPLGLVLCEFLVKTAIFGNSYYNLPLSDRVIYFKIFKELGKAGKYRVSHVGT